MPVKRWRFVYTQEASRLVERCHINHLCDCIDTRRLGCSALPAYISYSVYLVGLEGLHELMRR